MCTLASGTDKNRYFLFNGLIMKEIHIALHHRYLVALSPLPHPTPSNTAFTLFVGSRRVTVHYSDTLVVGLLLCLSMPILGNQRYTIAAAL